MSFVLVMNGSYIHLPILNKISDPTNIQPRKGSNTLTEQTGMDLN